jgi:hypothetical protein
MALVSSLLKSGFKGEGFSNSEDSRGGPQATNLHLLDLIIQNLSTFLNYFFALFPLLGPLVPPSALRCTHCAAPPPLQSAALYSHTRPLHETPALLRCRLLICWRFINRSPLRLEATAEMSDSAKLDKILEALSSVGKRCLHPLCSHSPSSKSLIFCYCAPSHTLFSLDTLESKVGGTSSSSSPAPAGGGGAAAPFVEGSLLHQ